MSNLAYELSHFDVSINSNPEDVRRLYSVKPGVSSGKPWDKFYLLWNEHACYL
jgi:hypothetical protein